MRRHRRQRRIGIGEPIGNGVVVAYFRLSKYDAVHEPNLPKFLHFFEHVDAEQFEPSLEHDADGVDKREPRFFERFIGTSQDRVARLIGKDKGKRLAKVEEVFSHLARISCIGRPFERRLKLHQSEQEFFLLRRFERR